MSRPAIRTKQGTLVDVQTNVLPYHEEEPGRYFLEVSTDIRERIRLRQTLLQVEKLTTMGQMAAGTAHHLNTPLASMLLRVQLARKHAQNASVDVDLGDLEGSIRYCQQFVRRLLDFSRRPQLTRRVEAIKDTLDSVLSFLSPQLVAKQIHLTLDMDPANGSAVMADRNQIEALFLILITNALDAVPPKGHITVRCHPADDRIHISIEDDGCGIAPANLPHIFEPFFTTKPVGKGTGLGLSIAATILQEHEGSIRIDSAPNQGTVVRIELPLSPQSSGTGEGHGMSEAATKCTVLVVDDDPSLTRTLKEFLVEEGYEVETAHDGEQALGSPAEEPRHLSGTVGSDDARDGRNFADGAVAPPQSRSAGDDHDRLWHD